MRDLHPWQVTPTELIKQAIDFLHRDTEESRQIAFLLLDVGVETLFKTFLLLSDSVTGVDVDYPERARAADGSFHKLVEGIKNSAGDRLNNIVVERVEYYHGIRNKLYHQGDGIIPTEANINDYASISVELLHQLLKVDLHSYLNKEINYNELTKARKSLIEQKLIPIQKELQTLSRDIRIKLFRILEDEESEFVKPSFLSEMEDFIHRMSAPDAMRWKSGVRRLIWEGLFVLDSNGIPIDRLHWHDDIDIFEFISQMVDERCPAGSYPGQLTHYMNEYNLPWGEYDLAEIVTADDITEALLLITDLMDDFSSFISVDDYRQIKTMLSWDAESAVSDQDFDKNLDEMINHGKELAGKVRSKLTIG